MFGPFRAGEAKATHIEEVQQGRFLIARKGLFLKAAKPGTIGGVGVDRSIPQLLKLDGAFPTLTDAGSNGPACMVLTEDAWLEISVSDPRAEDEVYLACVGVNEDGEFAVTAESSEASYFVEFKNGAARTDGHARFIWWKAWRIELVLEGDRRFLLADRKPARVTAV
jgi:hypothetical protein